MCAMGTFNLYRPTWDWCLIYLITLQQAHKRNNKMQILLFPETAFTWSLLILNVMCLFRESFLISVPQLNEMLLGLR